MRISSLEFRALASFLRNSMVGLARPISTILADWFLFFVLALPTEGGFPPTTREKREKTKINVQLSSFLLCYYFLYEIDVSREKRRSKWNKILLLADRKTR